MRQILISPKFIKDKNDNICHAIEHNWIRYSNEIGFCISLYNSSIKNFNRFDGLIIPGGNNLTKFSRLKIDKDREKIEKYLFKKFLKLNKPILGVCKGAQFIYDYYGLKIEKITGHIKKNHTIYNLNKQKYSVNSYHQYGLQKKNLKKNFEKFFISNDDTIEISKITNFPIYCMMFHPERKNKDHIFVNQYFRNIFKI